MSKKYWGYEDVTEHTESQMTWAMDMASKPENDRKLYLGIAVGMFYTWDSLTQKLQSVDDRERLRALIP